MLFCIKILSILFILIIFSFYLTRKSLFHTLIHSELLIIFFITNTLVVSSIFNSVVGIGVCLCILILGSLEIALCLLILML